MKDKEKTFSIKPYLKRHKFTIFAYSFLLLLNSLLNVILAVIPAHLLVAITQTNYNLAINYTLILGGVMLMGAIINLFLPQIHARISTRIVNEMRVDIAQQAFKISSSSYSNHQTSNFLQRINSDPKTILNSLMGFINCIGILLNIIVIFIYMLTFNIFTSLILIAYLVVLQVITFYRKNNRIKNQRKVNRENEKVSSLMNEIIRSERDIKSLNLEKKLKEVTNESLDNYGKSIMQLNKSGALFSSLDRFVSLTFVILFLVTGIVLLDKGFLILANFLILYNNRSVIERLSNFVSNAVINYADMKLSYERIGELYQDKEYELEKFGTLHIEDLGSDIEFKDVCFSYKEYKYNSKEEQKNKRKHNKKDKTNDNVCEKIEISRKQIFENLSFKVEPNSTVAFVGKSGCGKTTALNLISKLYVPDRGTVCIGGVDISAMDKETLRSSVSLVNQFPYIFDMTIKENLLLAKPEASDEEINQALTNSALDEFIATLPQGINTKVGESGIKLSGGQKQRLAIARALLKKSKVIILDESTSSLDNLAQNKVKESIDKIKGKSTIIIVAHRLSTIKNADKIFFMDNGKIIDTGTFNELIQKNEKFNLMYKVENI